MGAADCTGLTRAGMRWLSKCGYGLPSPMRGRLPLDELKIELDQKLRYSTLTFPVSEALFAQLPLSDECRTRCVLYVTFEEQTATTLAKGPALITLERVPGKMVLFFAHYGHRRIQPRSLAEAKDYLADLEMRVPIPDWFYETLERLEEVGDPVVSTIRVPPTSFIRYHLAHDLPSNFVALGDSVMNINPTFAEGTSKAARCALALKKSLLALPSGVRVLPADFGAKFFEEQNAKTAWMWESTRVNDYGQPTTEPIKGESLSSGALLRWYSRHLMKLTATDELAAWAFYTFQVGYGSGIEGFHPHVVAKVLWNAFTGHWRSDMLRK
ncbi:unnamed protein product [Mycena citricolor]|uniref:Uncharacterized protein n=1 Tax=Mycena citricolor TaxID=2018698 RepID=A0AAD2K0Z0_9AGAR|nr:unnamed protein product [Mycena citricolor]